MQFCSFSGPNGDALYRELWHACAGPLVVVPHERERVYYFPQGHMEQLEASTNQGLDQHMPLFNLPSKILCRVVHVQLRAEPDTDEVYAQITLLPEPDQSEVTSPDPPLPELERICPSIHLGKNWLPKICMGMNGISVTFFEVYILLLHCYLALRYFDLMRMQELFIFYRVSVFYVLLVAKSYEVLYQKNIAYQTSRSEFIISVNKYLEAKNHKLSVGMRFKMRFEGDEAPERRFSGTIIGVGDTTPSRWADSDWRSLKVQWDEPSSIPRPDRVSPWELEPLVAATPPTSQPAQRHKRARPLASTTITPNISSVFGLWKSPVESTQTFSLSGLQRGRELYPSSSLFSSTSKTGSIVFNGNVGPSAVTCRSDYWPVRADTQTESFSASINRETCEKKQDTGTGCRLFGIQLIEGSVVEETSLPVNISAGIGEDQPVTSVDADSDRQSQPSKLNRCDAPAVSSEPEKSCLRSPQETQSRQLRSCTKVHMQGMAVGRAVDLTRLDGYDELLRKLEEMFGIEGELTGAAKKWQVIYTDDEDDTMLVGDDPWHEFCSMVRKIYIYTHEEAKRLSSKATLPVISKATKLGSKKSSSDCDTPRNGPDDQVVADKEC
ncbi:Auxin response factor 7 [Cocos nucifera]|uniref:Auxin-responsive protein n=1 Tax=Cocos nucifera TaxID=13894 RepID=A0A8K0HZQ6_COCNU|nr:Auxin response factor 7 [Cocos nucifera]